MLYGMNYNYTHRVNNKFFTAKMLKIQDVSMTLTVIFFFAIVDICMILVHPQEYEIEKLH